MPNPLVAMIGGSVGSAVVSKKASDKATDASVAASQDSNALQKYIYDNNVELSEPQRIAGGNALMALQHEMGLPTGEFASYGAKEEAENPVEKVGGAATPEPEFTWKRGPGRDEPMIKVFKDDPQVGDNGLSGGPAKPIMDDPQVSEAPYEYKGYEASKGYHVQLDQGNQAIDRRNSAGGSRLGGAALKEAMRFNTGLASQDYGNYYNRLASMAGMGQTAVSQQAAAGQNYANAYGQNVTNAANARASGYENNASIFSNTVGNLGNIYGAYKGGAF
jgi:hypothetical protein